MKDKRLIMALSCLLALCFVADARVASVASGNGTTVDNATSPGNPIINLGSTLTSNVSFNLGPSYNFNFGQGSSSYLSILNNGNVGIGTSSPTATLHANGSFLFSNMNSYFTSAASLLSVPIPSDGRWEIQCTSSGYANKYTFAEYRDSYMGLGSGSSSSNISTYGISAPMILASDGVHCGTLIFGLNTGPANVSRLQIGVSNINEFTYGSAYPAGTNYYYIGTELATPEVASNIGQVPNRAPLYISAYYFSFDAGAGNEAAHIDYNGNLGLGTSAPTAQLHTTGTVRFAGIAANSSLANVLVSDANGNVGYASYTGMGGGNPSIWSPIASGSASERCTNTGNILIGSTTDNGSKLQVSGSGYFSSVVVGTAPGTATSPYVLAVNGSAIFAQAVVKLNANWPDYVLDPSYPLLPLNELHKYIQTNGHLPDVPTASEAEKDGIDLGASQTVLLKKIEELTLYAIEQNKGLQELKNENKKLQEQDQRIKALEEKIGKLLDSTR